MLGPTAFLWSRFFLLIPLLVGPAIAPPKGKSRLVPSFFQFRDSQVETSPLSASVGYALLHMENVPPRSWDQAHHLNHPVSVSPPIQLPPCPSSLKKFRRLTLPSNLSPYAQCLIRLFPFSKHCPSLEMWKVWTLELYVIHWFLSHASRS